MEIECQDFFFCGDGGFYLNIIKEVNISLKELLNSFKGVSLVVVCCKQG